MPEICKSSTRVLTKASGLRVLTIANGIYRCRGVLPWQCDVQDASTLALSLGATRGKRAGQPRTSAMPLKDSRNGLPELAACCANKRCPWCMPSNLPKATTTGPATPATAVSGLLQVLVEHSSTKWLHPANTTQFSGRTPCIRIYKLRDQSVPVVTQRFPLDLTAEADRIGDTK